MIRTPAPGLYGNPLVAWTQLAWKTGELMVNSGEVIGRRLAGMALAGASPAARDRREMTRMGGEKLQAATESGYAMWWSLARMNQQLALLALRQMLAGATSVMSIASSRTAAESLGRQAKLVGDSMANAAAAASHVSGSSARLARRGLAPVSARAARNAKRLRKRRR
jgi:hypothetical protein